MGFLADRSEAGSRVFPDLSAPPRFIRVRDATLIVNALTTLVFAVSCVLVGRALRRSKGVARRAMREILGMIVMSLAVNAWSVALVTGAHDWKGCAQLGSVGAALYIMMHFFCYRVLVVRAETVQEIMPTWYHHGLKLVRVSMYACYIISVLTFIAFSGKLYFAEDFCALRLNGSLPVMLAVVDTTLSVTLLGLFVVPVWKHSAARIGDPQFASSSGNVRNNESSKMLRRVALQNLLLSSVPIMSTVIYLIIIARTNTEDMYADPSQQHFAFAAMLGAGIDSMVNMLAIFVMFRKILFGSRRAR